jgi:hypothetical protein
MALLKRSFRFRPDRFGHDVKLSWKSESQKRNRPVDNEDNGHNFRPRNQLQNGTDKRLVAARPRPDAAAFAPPLSPAGGLPNELNRLAGRAQLQSHGKLPEASISERIASAPLFWVHATGATMAAFSGSNQVKD